MAHSESALADNIDAVATFTDAQILREVMSTATRCRKQLALLLIYIGEMDCRRAHVAAGFPSAFEFCRKRLSLSEGETVRRLRVARAARRFPILLDKIASGELHLTGAAFIARQLEASNARELIGAACGKSMHEIEVIFARLFPQEKKRDVIRPVAPVQGKGFGTTPTNNPLTDQRAPLLLPPPPSANRASGGVATGPVSTAAVESAAATGPSFAEPTPSCASPQIEPPSPVSPLPSVTAAAEATYRLHVTLDQKTLDALREAQDLLRHSLPYGNVSDLVAMALQELVEGLRKRKFARRNLAHSKKTVRGAETNKDVPTHLETDAQVAPSNTHIAEDKQLAAVCGAEASSIPTHLDTGAQAATSDTHVLNCELADKVCEAKASSAPGANASGTSTAAPGIPAAPSPATVTVTARRYIPAHIKRAVAERDGFACSFVAGDGTRCGSRSLLEYHHRIPFARGGMHTVENVGMLCRSHNFLAAEHDFGQKHQARFRRRLS